MQNLLFEKNIRKLGQKFNFAQKAREEPEKTKHLTPFFIEPQ